MTVASGISLWVRTSLMISGVRVNSSGYQLRGLPALLLSLQQGCSDSPESQHDIISLLHDRGNRRLYHGMKGLFLLCGSTFGIASKNGFYEIGVGILGIMYIIGQRMNISASFYEGGI